MNISVPRENVGNKGVCKDVEDFVLEKFNKNTNEAYHTKDLTKMVMKKFGKKYGELEYHVVRALDQFFANRLIKRVAPSVFQHRVGPDDEYSERASGHVPDDQPYAKRPGNYTKNPTVPSARGVAKFNAEVRKVQASISILKNCNMSPEVIKEKLIDSGNFNPVAVKFCINQLQMAA